MSTEEPSAAFNSSIVAIVRRRSRWAIASAENVSERILSDFIPQRAKSNKFQQHISSSAGADCHASVQREDVRAAHVRLAAQRAVGSVRVPPNRANLFLRGPLPASRKWTTGSTHTCTTSSSRG